MDISSILSRVDHTLLLQTATEAEILALCDDGIRYGVSTVCIPQNLIKTRSSSFAPHGCTFNNGV